MVATTGDTVTQGGFSVVASLQNLNAQVSQGAVSTVANADFDHRVSQAYFTVVVSESAAEPNAQAWTATIDGHDFYFLQLPEETLVYDFHSQNWSVWGSGDEKLWTAQTGLNWTASLPVPFDEIGIQTTTVLAGDKDTGVVYFLDPEKIEDDANDPLLDALPFQRLVYGQVSVRGYDRQPCYGVQVTGSLGEEALAALSDVTLYSSDDGGATFNSHGTQTVNASSLENRLQWRSLGSIKGPGRLFKIEDYGALTRIDGLDMPSDPESK